MVDLLSATLHTYVSRPVSLDRSAEATQSRSPQISQAAAAWVLCFGLAEKGDQRHYLSFLDLVDTLPPPKKKKKTYKGSGQLPIPLPYAEKKHTAKKTPYIGVRNLTLFLSRCYRYRYRTKDLDTTELGLVSPHLGSSLATYYLLIFSLFFTSSPLSFSGYTFFFPFFSLFFRWRWLCEISSFVDILTGSTSEHSYKSIFYAVIKQGVHNKHL